MKILTSFIFLLLASTQGLASAEDIALILRNENDQASKRIGFGGLGGALAEVDLGYFLRADEYHQWRARVLGDISLLNYSDRINWHMGLSMATLADLQNDINFRLVQLYYDAVSGVKWKLSSLWLEAGYRHRCSHGADSAVNSRITIRSGFFASLYKSFVFKNWHFDLKPGAYVVMFGQNNNFRFQPKGSLFLTLQALWTLKEHLALVGGAGAHVEMVSIGTKPVYFLSDSIQGLKMAPIFGARAGVRLGQGRISSDIVLAFKQILDTSIGPSAEKKSQLSLDINFLW